MLTVSPFYHHNTANYESGPLDLPSSTTEDRSSNYEGGQATVSWVKKRSDLRTGLYGFAQQDSQLFGLIVSDNSGPSLTPPDLEKPVGSLFAVYGEDQFAVTSVAYGGICYLLVQENKKTFTNLTPS